MFFGEKRLKFPFLCEQCLKLVHGKNNQSTVFSVQAYFIRRNVLQMELEPLLNAVGKDISVVVQPVTFVREIQKQIKKLKNYKDYLAL